MAKKAIFRTDASPATGSGHVMRCLTLADALTKAKAGWTCSFLSDAETIDTVPALKNSDYKILTPDSLQLDPRRSLSSAKAGGGDDEGKYEDDGFRYDLLVIDHYELCKIQEGEYRTWAKKIMVIDDLADREHDCDILLDQTYGRDAEDYKNLVPAHCKILTGAQYALLRPQFMDMRETSLQRRKDRAGKIEHILISLGSTNVNNITGKVLDTFANFTTLPFSINVVLGSRAPELDYVRSIAGDINRQGVHKVTLLTDVENMAELMAKADLAIGAGGTTSWERCCLGLPTLLINVADNQDKISTELAKAGACKLIGSYKDISSEKIIKSVTCLLNNPNEVYAMNIKSAAICDGTGVDKIVRAITNVCS